MFIFDCTEQRTTHGYLTIALICHFYLCHSHMQLKVEFTRRHNSVFLPPDIVFVELLDIDFNEVVFYNCIATSEHNYIEMILNVLIHNIHLSRHAVAKRLSNDQQLQDFFKKKFQQKLIRYQGV